MLKAWLDTEESHEMARLFSVGNARASDLIGACRGADDEIATAAFLTLQLLGKSDCEPCVDSLSRRHGELLLSCTSSLTNVDFERIEQWSAKTRALSLSRCGGEDEPRIDDSLVYALILDGSPHSHSALKRMVAAERVCKETDTIVGETLEQWRSLVAAAKEIGRDLKLEPDIHKAIRASAFFLPSEYRKDSKVEVLARADHRILLEVSYNCGRLCGRGYYVALRKDGPVWQYAVIRMAWIS